MFGSLAPLALCSGCCCALFLVPVPPGRDRCPQLLACLGVNTWGAASASSQCWRTNTPASWYPRGTARRPLLHHLPMSPVGLSPGGNLLTKEPSLYWLPPFPGSLPHSRLSVSGVDYQLDHSHANPCLRECFWGFHPETLFLTPHTLLCIFCLWIVLPPGFQKAHSFISPDLS